MFRYGLVCSLETLTPDKPSVFQGSLEGYADKVRAIGYDAIELHLRNPAQVDPDKLKSGAANAGLFFCALSTGLEYGLNHLSLISDEARVRQAAIRRLTEHIDLAAELSCGVVIGTMRANIPDRRQQTRYLGYLSEALLTLADYAAPRQVTLLVESITRYIDNYLNTVPETAAYLVQLNRPNLLLHIDTHSMQIEDPDFPAAIRASKPVLGYVHVSDSNRRFPGGGNIDFKTVLRELRAIGYSGLLTSECLPWPDAESSARLGLTYLKALEACLDVEAYRLAPAEPERIPHV
ncbi:MAG: sugar phosphate isomerase/epimerase [Clostridiaceae bacterium]|jgi:sugar phosphate isomerase/epimerase|nr:sugar phosphate isomerase/epimerase [Clostridiaceae bacterium]